MDRRDDKIIFTEEEQDEFSVEAEVSPESALATAAMFKRVADSLDAKATQLSDRSDNRVRVTSQKLALRAGRLSSFALGIEKQCSSEIDAEFMRQLNNIA